MDFKGMTLGRALRLRSTITSKIKQAATRAKSSAIFSNPGPKPDFNVEEQIALYTEEQQKLRELKVKTAAKSLNTKVTIPEDIPVAEAGKQVSVYAAVLIRDDLKARKQLLTAIIDTPLEPDRRELLYVARSENPPAEKKRNFDFQWAVENSEKLQDAIDTLDGIIQGTDATTKFE